MFTTGKYKSTCIKDTYKLMVANDTWHYKVKNHWWLPWKKVSLGPWWEFWCEKHRRGHRKPLNISDRHG